MRLTRDITSAGLPHVQKPAVDALRASNVAENRSEDTGLSAQEGRTMLRACTDTSGSTTHAVQTERTYLRYLSTSAHLTHHYRGLVRHPNRGRQTYLCSTSQRQRPQEANNVQAEEGFESAADWRRPIGIWRCVLCPGITQATF